ncbi:hypothetical protein LC653_44855 [Nostoc sp. CHAB 5784]|uniref:hypothetical protein n=1 Tax=Nostoc mirabile TaxID=2907820 RepID=UPI001E4AC07A|nr:hypothetical protein [Nostoc mirabile]MCC5670704.1 hypothetical protein [Nostoc mirabile CHAB5784]
MEVSLSSPQSILSFIAESPSDVGYWSDEWGVGGKSGAKSQKLEPTSFILNQLL